MEWKVKNFQQLSISELYEILRLRAEVFVVEQNCPYQDVDDKDQDSYHLWGMDNNKMVVYARIVKPGVSYKEVSIGRVITHLDYRGKQLGTQLMQECLDFINTELGPQKIRISAQSHLNKFYLRLGFKPTGKEYLEDGIPHMEMLLQP